MKKQVGYRRDRIEKKMFLFFNENGDNDTKHMFAKKSNIGSW